MKDKGFTLIEIIIVLSILSIIISVIAGIPKNKQKDEFNCIAGYKFVGNVQILDSQGKGISCNIQPTGSLSK